MDYIKSVLGMNVPQQLILLYIGPPQGVKLFIIVNDDSGNFFFIRNCELYTLNIDKVT